MFLEPRALWSTAPPEPRSRAGNWPTLLFSWWCTGFAAVIIVTRVLGRKVRSHKLFREDWIMLAAIVPLFIRMVLIHFVLLYGTNNVETVGHEYTPRQLYLRSIGSQLVLPARIFYAAFIWMSKLTVSEFLKRITGRIWRKRYEWTLQGIRIFLAITLLAVVIATLAECIPFNHYWQVVPDPGPQCRQGFVQLLVMGSTDIVTDILLVAFPIPVVLASGQNWKRKLQMICLFALSLVMIGITATRMPKVISRHGRQQYRTIWASCEILASAFVSNGVILGSFLRDKGEKKNKFRKYSVTESMERSAARRPTLTRIRTHHSEEDLFLAMGCRPPEHLRDDVAPSTRPAPPALPAHKTHLALQRPDTPLGDLIDGDDSDFEAYEDISPTMTRVPQVLPSPSTSTTAGLHDFGNLQDSRRPSESSPASRKPSNTSSAGPGINAYDFARTSSELPTRSGSTFLRNVGSRFLVPDFVRDKSEATSATQQQRNAAHRIRPTTAPIGVLGPMLERQESEVSLQDPGGLLMSSPVSKVDFGKDRRPPVARGASKTPRRKAEDIELVDIGGLLSNIRRAGAVHHSHSHERRDLPSAQRPVGLLSTQKNQGVDDMVLNDPGGLMHP